LIDQIFLKIFSFTVEVVSVVSLVTTIAVLIYVRKLVKNDRTVVQINLAFAVFFLHVFNLFHDLALENDRACEMTAVLIHFFLLATSKII